MMNPPDLLLRQEEIAPNGDEARQAVESLRGYAYQVTAAALAWIDLSDKGKLFLEVAEDYAIVAANDIHAVQVKDTKASESATLNNENVREAIASFVSLAASNPHHEVTLRYFTTAPIGTEKAIADRPVGEAGLLYWRRAAAASDVGPIRVHLESDKFPKTVREFVRARDNESLRRDLLRRIHWDCGNPDINSLRQEFEDRLIVLGRDKFNLPAPEAVQLADILIYRALQRSIQKAPDQRVLTRAELYNTIDQAKGRFVPLSSLHAMQALASAMAQMVPNADGSLQLAISEPGWIVRSETLPNHAGMVSRDAVETKIQEALRCDGTCVIVGASGLGKSSLADVVAAAVSDTFVIADFRDADPDDACTRLDEIFRRAVGFTGKVFILEDLNQLDDPRVTRSLLRLIETLRRRDCTMIVTCYRDPSAKTLHNLNLGADCIVHCPYFTEEESAALVQLHGGDPSIWGRIAHVAGAFGHPQLVLAFVDGISARGWPNEELVEVVGNGLSSGDIDSERETARRTLMGTLPESTRSLLYRLSLSIGRFDRPLALAIANVPPGITLGGEHLDALIGPWIETVASGTYRVSPLAARSGHDMIQAKERTAIHHAIADHYMSGRVIDGGRADVIMAHAIAGKNEPVLTKLSLGILTTDRGTLGQLVSSLPTFLLLGAHGPIYPDSPQVSAFLRLTQFKLLTESTETGKIAACADALFSEVQAVPASHMRGALQALVYGTVLGTIGIANHLNGWLRRLEEFHHLTDATELLQSYKEGYEKKHEKYPDMFGTLFAIGAQGLTTVARLESLIEQLDALTLERRNQYLSLLSAESSDFSTFISGPWVADRPVDPTQALVHAERYQRMAARTLPWSMRPITVQCWIARSVMLDEYADQREQAFAVLDEAEQVLGEDVALTRARAKIYFRTQDHASALQLSKKVADQIGLDNPVERAFALREAAISAAKVGDWSLARSWFLESKEAAEKCATPDMAVMAVGLRADAAVAAVHTGRMDDALRGFAGALNALPNIDSESSLRAAHCHRLVRHSVLWVLSRLVLREIVIDGAPPFMTPGVCSNPEPSEQIKSSPLGPLDAAWYLLAEAEIVSGQDVGITQTLPSQLAGGRILPMEIGLRGKVLEKAIVDSDLGRFVANVWPFVEAMAAAAANKQLIRDSADQFNFPRGEIPILPRAPTNQGTGAIVVDAAFSYVICSICKGNDPGLENILAALQAKFGNPFPGMELLVLPPGTNLSAAAGGLEEGLLRTFRLFKIGTSPLPPDIHCMIAIWFYDWAKQSNFKPQLIAAIARWQRETWARIVRSETFKLSMPRLTVPLIEQALSMERDDIAFLASLILAAAPAAQLQLPAHVEAQFKSLC